MKRTPLRKKRKGPPRRGRVYDKPYRDWLAREPCIVCGWDRGCEAAHTKLLGSGGAGMKASDHSCVSLCWKCHRHYHTFGREAAWEQAVKAEWGQEWDLKELWQAQREKYLAEAA